MSHIRQFMKEGSCTINGFEMGDIILLDPDGINHRLHIILKAEIENVFWMRIADRETEGRPTYQFVEDGGCILVTCSDIERDVFTVLTRCDN
jgi:hypothetical protein